MIFFYKQKKAYEMRISDWSSDVCSSDLDVEKKEQPFDKLRANGKEAADGHPPADRAGNRLRPAGHRAKRRPKPATRDRGGQLPLSALSAARLSCRSPGELAAAGLPPRIGRARRRGRKGQGQRPDKR